MRTSKLFIFALTITLSLFFAFAATKTNAFAGNDKDLKNTPTHSVSVNDIIRQSEMPRELRSGHSVEMVNSLAINGFNIKSADEGKYALVFNLEKAGTAYVRIVDNAGYDVFFETFRDGNTYNKQIDLSLLPAGTYFFQVTQGGKTFTKKLIFS